MPGASPSRSPKDPLSAGELLSGRFRVVRRIARGGMGVVYEAYDEKLGRRIALKCALSGHGSHLTPEVRLATEVSHPNICKIYEIHTAETPEGAVEYFTMEFLEGPTLAARLESGPVPRGEAETIARAICAGLAEAHRNGIVHGDLKPANVILAADVSGKARPVIADFGLARFTAGPGGRGGTHGYMAPELFTGSPLSVASDIYALGVILHELACGFRPDERAAMLETTVTQVAGEPASSAAPAPAKLPPVPSRWNPVIRKCLDPDPQLRPRTADDVLAALGPSPIRRRIRIAAAALALAALAAFVAYRQSTAPRTTVRLDVAPLAAPSELGSEIASLRDNAARRLSSIAGSREIAFSVVSARPTHRLTASLAAKSGKWSLHASLLDLASKTPTAEWSADYDPAQLRFIPVALAGLVSASFHLPPLTDHATVSNAAAEPYRKGLDALHDDARLDEAVSLFSDAARLDPDSALPWAGLAEAQRRKYHLTRVPSWKDAAFASWQQAELRNPDCGPVHRIAGLLEFSRNRPEQAVERMRRATEFQPPNSDAFYRLALLYERQNRMLDALQAYNEALRLAPGDIVIYDDLAHAYSTQSDFASASSILERAVRIAPNDARLRFRLASSYQDQGRFADAEAVLRSALERDKTSDGLMRLGHVLLYQRRDSDALPILAQAVELDPANLHAWLYLGVARARLDRGRESQAAFRRGLKLAQAAVLRLPRDGYTRALLAYLYAQCGQTEAAFLEAGQARQLAPRHNDTLWMSALAYERLGRRADALGTLEAAPRPMLEDLKRWPEAAALTGDARFAALFPPAGPR